MLIRYAGYVIGFVMVLIVLLLGFVCMGCGKVVEYPKVDTCHDDCRIVFHVMPHMPCRDIDGNQLNLPQFRQFAENVIGDDTTTDKQKEYAKSLLDRYYKKYNLDTMLDVKDIESKPKPKSKYGRKHILAVIVGIGCGLAFGALVMLPCLLDRRNK